jgi:hypothetical protein
MLRGSEIQSKPPPPASQPPEATDITDEPLVAPLRGGCAAAADAGKSFGVGGCVCCVLRFDAFYRLN